MRRLSYRAKGYVAPTCSRFTDVVVGCIGCLKAFQLELPEFGGQGLASMRSAGGKRHVLEEGSEQDQAGLPVH